MTTLLNSPIITSREWRNSSRSWVIRSPELDMPGRCLEVSGVELPFEHARLGSAREESRPHDSSAGMYVYDFIVVTSTRRIQATDRPLRRPGIKAADCESVSIMKPRSSPGDSMPGRHPPIF